HEHVERVLGGEAIREEFLPVLSYSNDNVVSEANVETARLVRHNVNPVALHGAKVYHSWMLGRSRFLGYAFGMRCREGGAVFGLATCGRGEQTCLTSGGNDQVTCRLFSFFPAELRLPAPTLGLRESEFGYAPPEL